MGGVSARFDPVMAGSSRVKNMGITGFNFSEWFGEGLDFVFSFFTAFPGIAFKVRCALRKVLDCNWRCPGYVVHAGLCDLSYGNGEKNLCFYPMWICVGEVCWR